MGKEKDFNNILDECLDRMLFQGEPLELCLASYPEHSAELESLLQTALAAREAAAIKPRTDFRERARNQFQAAVRDMEAKKERRVSFFGRHPQWVTAIVVVLVILFAGSGVVAVAGDSMPDGLLYSVKRASETVRLAFTPSDLGKAELYASLADERVTEIVYLADNGNTEQIDEVTGLLEEHLTVVAGLMLPQEADTAASMAPASRAMLEAPRVLSEPEAETAPLETAPQMAPALAPSPVPPAALPEDAPASVMEVPEAPSASLGGEEAVPALPDDEKVSAPNEIIEVTSEAELGMLLSIDALDNREALLSALERAPESLKPALLRALGVADAGYQKALEALG